MYSLMRAEQRLEIYQKVLTILENAKPIEADSEFWKKYWALAIESDNKVLPLCVCPLLKRLAAHPIIGEFIEWAAQRPKGIRLDNLPWFPDAYSGGIEIRIGAVKKAIELCKKNLTTS